MHGRCRRRLHFRSCYLSYVGCADLFSRSCAQGGYETDVCLCAQSSRNCNKLGFSTRGLGRSILPFSLSSISFTFHSLTICAFVALDNDSSHSCISYVFYTVAPIPYIIYPSEQQSTAQYTLISFVSVSNIALQSQQVQGFPMLQRLAPCRSIVC